MYWKIQPVCKTVPHLYLKYTICIKQSRRVFFFRKLNKEIKPKRKTHSNKERKIPAHKLLRLVEAGNRRFP